MICYKITQLILRLILCVFKKAASLLHCTSSATYIYTSLCWWPLCLFSIKDGGREVHPLAALNLTVRLQPTRDRSGEVFHAEGVFPQHHLIWGPPMRISPSCFPRLSALWNMDLTHGGMPWTFIPAWLPSDWVPTDLKPSLKGPLSWPPTPESCFPATHVSPAASVSVLLRQYP